MKKRVLCMLMALFVCGLAGCGEEPIPTQEVDYSMIFENQTGLNVSKLEIRPFETAEWSEITLSEAEWKNSYEMPVSMQGQMPIAEDGWQVQMTFGDDIKRVWEGVHFDDDVTFTFTMEDDEMRVITSADIEEESVEEEVADQLSQVDGTATVI